MHSAGIQDRDGFALVVEKVKRRFPGLRIVFADTGYNAIQVECAAAQNRLRLEIVKRPQHAEGFHLLPRRSPRSAGGVSFGNRMKGLLAFHGSSSAPSPWLGRNRRSARRQYQRLGRRYASDLTDEEFAVIEPMLPPARWGGRRRTMALREVLNAILYLLRTGCQWRMLPEGFPPRSTVYGYFRRFWQRGIWTRIWMALMMAAREQAGKEASPSAAIVDSQSVKTTESGGIRGFDAGKKIMGRKRHLLTDTLGLPLVLIVHAADIQDRDGLAQVCHRVRRRFPWLTLIYADAGYQGDQAACAAAQQRLRLEVVRRPRGTEGFHLLPRRWVIERTFAWLGRNRRLTKDVEKLVETSTAMAAVAVVQLLVRRLATK